MFIHYDPLQNCYYISWTETLSNVWPLNVFPFVLGKKINKMIRLKALKPCNSGNFNRFSKYLFFFGQAVYIQIWSIQSSYRNTSTNTKVKNSDITEWPPVRGQEESGRSWLTGYDYDKSHPIGQKSRHYLNNVVAYFTMFLIIYLRQ